MNYYQPKWFTAKEVFPPSTIKDHTTAHGNITNVIWRLFDWRVLWTADQLRERFGLMYANDYEWGGQYKYRGFRPPTDLIDWKHFNLYQKIKAISPYTFTSQHCFGRALDVNFKDITAQEVIDDIKINYKQERYKYIRAVEEGVSWFHFDCRSLSTDFGDEVLFFSN